MGLGLGLRFGVGVGLGFLRREERVRRARRARAPRAANAVDVVLDLLREVVVDDAVHAWYITRRLRVRARVRASNLALQAGRGCGVAPGVSKPNPILTLS